MIIGHQGHHDHVFSMNRIPLHKSKINRVLLKLVSDLCPSNTEVPDKAGKDGVSAHVCWLVREAHLCVYMWQVLTILVQTRNSCPVNPSGSVLCATGKMLPWSEGMQSSCNPNRMQLHVRCISLHVTKCVFWFTFSWCDYCNSFIRSFVL